MIKAQWELRIGIDIVNGLETKNTIRTKKYSTYGGINHHKIWYQLHVFGSIYSHGSISFRHCKFIIWIKYYMYYRHRPYNDVLEHLIHLSKSTGLYWKHWKWLLHNKTFDVAFFFYSFIKNAMIHQKSTLLFYHIILQYLIHQIFYHSIIYIKTI